MAGRLVIVLAMMACVFALPKSQFRDVNTIVIEGLDVTTLSPEHETSLEETIAQVRQESAGSPSLAVGELVDSWHPNNGANPEELGTYNQGDILHTPNLQRNGIINTAYRWPKGVIPYRIVGLFTTAQRNMIMAAMEEYHKNTCIRFVPYSGQADYVNIEGANTGCWSNLGRSGGVQRVNLQMPGCLYYIGTVIHELLHTVGFYHEQSRTDRDQFITVNWGNISPGTEHNFNTYVSTPFGVTYDYGSVMHYSSRAFSKNNLDTIVPKDPNASIGQRKGFSPGDIAKIHAMYKCNGSISML